RRRHTRFSRDWSSDVCSSDLGGAMENPSVYFTPLSRAAFRNHCCPCCFFQSYEPSAFKKHSSRRQSVRIPEATPCSKLPAPILRSEERRVGTESTALKSQISK